MPWEGPIKQIVDSVSRPVAKAIVPVLGDRFLWSALQYKSFNQLSFIHAP